jgi:myo-inositol-1(or 4)-monophosphatase
MELGERVAREAGALLRGRLGGEVQLLTKSSATDAVTQADRDSEALILAGIRAERPDDGVVGEEGTSVESRSGINWLIDPIDGTVNYLYGHPSGWCVSIAALDESGVIAGVVYDPMREELFSAGRGLGATLNGRRLQVSAAEDLTLALIATGFGYRTEVRRQQAQVLASILPQVRDIRRCGSAALDVCWVAAARVDAYYEWGVNPWDWSAAGLVVREAGGRAEQRADGVVIAAPGQLWGPLEALVPEFVAPG